MRNHGLSIFVKEQELMQKSFNNEKIAEYRIRLLNAFPHTLKKDVEIALAVLPFQVNCVNVFGKETYTVDNLIHESNFSIQLNKEVLIIPYRLYFDEPEKNEEEKLNETQKTILNCIYLRHSNGFVRQKRLGQLTDKNEYWVTPFTLSLLGEYVFEVLEVLDEVVDDNNVVNYQLFIDENPKYWQQTESRMISYWNEYYRRPRFPKLKDYLGQKIVKRIKKVK